MFSLNRPLLLTIISLLLSTALANCKSSCEVCTGDEYCTVNKKPDCQEGNIDCTDPCLALEIRDKYCFKSSIPDGKNCDNTCDYCVKQYKCNPVMTAIGICNDKVFDCANYIDCLDGEPKKLCAGSNNNGNCHEDCSYCIGTDSCAVSNSTQCSDEKIDCLATCLNKDVRKAACFESVVPDGSNCDSTCDFCIDQFKCNGAMRNASLCKEDAVHCVDWGLCLTKSVLDSCGMERNTDRDCGDCASCFSSVDCNDKNNTINELYGLCTDGKFNCDGACVAPSVRDDKCESIGAFCTISKEASGWAKARCFLVGFGTLLLVVLVLVAFCCCSSRGGGKSTVVHVEPLPIVHNHYTK